MTPKLGRKFSRNVSFSFTLIFDTIFFPHFYVLARLQSQLVHRILYSIERFPFSKDPPSWECGDGYSLRVRSPAFFWYRCFTYRCSCLSVPLAPVSRLLIDPLVLDSPSFLQACFFIV